MEKEPQWGYQQKVVAIGTHLYLQGGKRKWEPKAGDYYTIRRGDLELFHIESLDEAGTATVTSNVATGSMVHEGFASMAFHEERIPVPEALLFPAN